MGQQLWVFDTIGPPQPVVTDIQFPLIDLVRLRAQLGRNRCLVEISGELLLVDKLAFTKTMEVCKFIIHKFDLNTSTWMRLTTIGNNILILHSNFSSSLASNALLKVRPQRQGWLKILETHYLVDCNGLVPNCIHFNFEHETCDGLRDIGWQSTKEDMTTSLHRIFPS
ncbi:hypothetical protein GIB67_018294 [Kingdonia uniflora]|nr:hypothetical protein GIB67_018294 [Kingdonia uniflora]